MKEQYISPELNVFCFAPVERLANDEEYNALMDLGTEGGNKPSAGFDDGDFGLEIL